VKGEKNSAEGNGNVLSGLQNKLVGNENVAKG